MNIEQIHPNYVCQVWPHIKDMLAKALVRATGEYTIDQLQFMLVRGENHLLVAYDEDLNIHGAASVAMVNYPAERVAFITAIAGRLITSEDLYGKLVAWCKSNGCTEIQGAAQETIARLWKQKFGFTQKYIIVGHKI